MVDKKYITVFRLGMIHALKNYKALIGLSFFLVTCLIIFAHLWKIAAGRAGAQTLPADALLWYIAFNEWVLIAVPEIQVDMEEDLRSGRLAYLLPRPISYLGGVFAEAAGTLCVNLVVLGAVCFLFTWLRIGSIPFTAPEFLIMLLLGLAAGIVGLLFQMVIGLMAFWVQEVSPFQWMWEKLLFMLGGLILPLTVYPEWIQAIANLTPFPAILGGRSALVFDFSTSHILAIVSSLATWSALGIITIALLYRRGLRILNIGGG